jgi:hypothetical protein
MWNAPPVSHVVCPGLSFPNTFPIYQPGLLHRWYYRPLYALESLDMNFLPLSPQSAPGFASPVTRANSFLLCSPTRQALQSSGVCCACCSSEVSSKQGQKAKEMGTGPKPKYASKHPRGQSRGEQTQNQNASSRREFLIKLATRRHIKMPQEDPSNH